MGVLQVQQKFQQYEEAVSSPAYEDFYNDYLKKDLETGDFNLGSWLLGTDKKKSDKKGKIHHDQLNKDSESHPLHNYARAVATTATQNYIMFFIQGSSGSTSSGKKKIKRAKGTPVPGW